MHAIPILSIRGARRLGLLLMAVSTPALQAQLNTATEPVGYSTIPLLANSETIVSVPFQRPATYTGKIAAVTGDVVTVVGAPNWTANRFVSAGSAQPDTFYAFILSGAKEGHWFNVVANGTNTLTLNPANGGLAGLASGDRFKLVAHWTLGTLLPASGAGLAFTATTDFNLPETTIFLSDAAVPGINAAPSAGFVFSAGSWRQLGQSFSISRDDVIVPPGKPFRVRNVANGGVFVATGTVVLEKHALLLATRTNSEQDNPVALLRPVPVSLNDAGLLSSGIFASSANALARSDLLLVFDNLQTQLNKPAADFYFFYNGGWRKLGEPLTQDFGAENVFGPAKGVVIRKAATPGGSPQTWVNSPKY